MPRSVAHFASRRTSVSTPSPGRSRWLPCDPTDRPCVSPGLCALQRRE